MYLILGLLFTGMWLIDSEFHGPLPIMLADVLVLLSPLLMLALVGFLLINGAQMVRREGLRVANLLSLGLGIVLLIPYLLLALALLTGHIAWVVILAALAMVLGYFGFLFLSFLLYSLIYGMLPVRRGVDAIVIHGAGLIGDRVPPLLAARLDHALGIYRAEIAAGHHPLMVCSGGKGTDETVTEASAMARYIVDRGVPVGAVLMEDTSTTTRENLINTRELLGRQSAAPSVLNRKFTGGIWL
ncbi:hypothetical protein NS14008_28540 [Nocardia seriolae]|nr:hypothetical protein NS14008_28540 [Nocardia seriolae]